MQLTVRVTHCVIGQGVYPPKTFKSLGLPGEWYGALEYQYPPHQRQGSYAEEGRSVNHLKVRDTVDGCLGHCNTAAVLDNVRLRCKGA